MNSTGLSAASDTEDFINMAIFSFGIGVFLLYIQGSGAISCPSGFESHGQSCYFFSHGEETWIGALESCKLFNAKLVEVNDQVENSYLSNKVATLGGYWWIGLADKLIEGEYIWETSMTQLMPGDFFYWGVDEPNGQDNENCVFYAPSRNYKWADATCSRTEHYICEVNGEGGEVIG